MRREIEPAGSSRVLKLESLCVAIAGGQGLTRRRSQPLCSASDWQSPGQPTGRAGLLVFVLFDEAFEVVAQVVRVPT